MAPLPANDIPSFWTEPWRWAAPAWRAQYGVQPCDVDRYAERLIYSGWVECFGLRRRWCPPVDPRWLIVVHASPAVLQDVASVLGHLASLRAGASVALACRPPIDRWHAFALRYRDVNCMRSQTAAALAEPLPPYERGVRVLRAMARLDWPDADSRLAMLISPDALSTCTDAVEPLLDPRPPVDRIDVGRCLSLCCAAVRHAMASAMLRGGQ